MFCAKCGKELEHDARFCAECGTVVKKKADAPKMKVPKQKIPKPILFSVVGLATVIIIAVIIAKSGVANTYSKERGIKKALEGVTEQMDALSVRISCTHDAEGTTNGVKAESYSNDSAVVNFINNEAHLSEGETYFSLTPIPFDGTSHQEKTTFEAYCTADDEVVRKIDGAEFSYVVDTEPIKMEECLWFFESIKDDIKEAEIIEVDENTLKVVGNLDNATKICDTYVNFIDLTGDGPEYQTTNQVSYELLIDMKEKRVKSICFDLSDIAAYVWYGSGFSQTGITDISGSMTIEYLQINDADSFTIPSFEGGKQAAQSSDGVLSTDISASDKSYCNTYADFLRFYISDFSTTPKFQMGYIDEDDIPELFIIDGNGHVNGVKIYTYYNNNVKEVEEFGSYGSMSYAPMKNFFVSSNSGMGASYNTFYSLHLGNEEVIHDFCLYEDFVGEDYTLTTLECSIDGVEVSEEEYDRELEKAYEEISATINYDTAYEINEENIRSRVLALLETEDGGINPNSLGQDEDIDISVEQIRIWYYDTQDRLDSLLYASYDTNLDCYFDGGCPAKVVAKSGYNGWNVSREYYYHDQELYFVFVYGDIGEYRFYVKNGVLIRSISPDGNITDMGNEVSQDVLNIWERIKTEEESFPLMVNCGA